MLTIKNLLLPEIKKALQKSIESELYASNLYKHLANQMQRLGYFGAQEYYAKESADELTHYQMIADFMNDMGDVASVPAVKAIEVKTTSLGDALAAQYKAEYDLLVQYEEYYDMSEGKDCVTAVFLMKFLKIQRKAVGQAGDLISRLNRCGNNEAAILAFDDYLKNI